ncbi:MAG: ribonuclease III [Holosporaceae bacterium]|jgi:ribonuclease III|nr:ribonuclease III [Holosporaceae bacterium]
MAASEGVAKLQNIIGYEFKNPNLITIAVAHPGLKKDDSIAHRDFERLEFLGDRVLGLSLAEFLYEKFPHESVGNLAVRIAMLAGTDFMISLAKKAKIIDCFSTPQDFFISSNKNSASIADMFEAVLGAIFLDADFKTVKRIIVKLWENDVDVPLEKDSKSLLQEISQSKTGLLPNYSNIKMTGEAHDPTFEVTVEVSGQQAIGRGNSKKNAERDAATKLIKKLRN